MPSRTALLLTLLAAARGLPAGQDTSQQVLGYDPVERARLRNVCPPYTLYASIPHKGPLALPFQRPAKQCRTFKSPAVEQVIQDITSRMTDPDLARIFENAFPNTLDTTVSWHDPGVRKEASRRMPLRGGQAAMASGPQSFIVTGDITAEWLRDSTNQLQAYHALAAHDPALKTLILGAIATQADYVLEAPYCNAFQPPRGSGLAPSNNGMNDEVHPAYEPDRVFECKYELDSLAHFLRLGNEFYHATQDASFLTENWFLALDTVLGVVAEQSVPTFNATTGRYLGNEYQFRRETRLGTETLNLRGLGNPIANGTGLVRSAFRPSDDATILPFFIPANAMLSVELRRAAVVLAESKPDLADHLSALSKRIHAGIQEFGIVRHPRWGDVYAFEVDGYGSQVLMDDANVPSLLSLPMLGFVDAADPVYRNTRKMILAQSGNPYFLTGSAIQGIGGPHVGLRNAWPMSLLVQALTSDNEEEIEECLGLVRSTSRLGLIHETINVDSVYTYTRSWFAWANSVYAQVILDLAHRKPHLLFGHDAVPYQLQDLVVQPVAAAPEVPPEDDGDGEGRVAVRQSAPRQRQKQRHGYGYGYGSGEGGAID